MADWEPGPKYLVSAGERDQAVLPGVGGTSSDQRNWAPPHSVSWMPRCWAYQAASALGSRARKKTPPMPVMRAMDTSVSGKQIPFGNDKQRSEERRVGEEWRSR